MSSTSDNIAVWFEIPVTDLDRASRFYETMFNCTLKREAFGPDMMMAIFDAAGGAVKGALVHGPIYHPGASGTLVYLNGGADLAAPLSRVEAAGGQVMVGKTQINDTCGYYAVFMDSEGNRVGLHSMA